MTLPMRPAAYRRFGSGFSALTPARQREARTSEVLTGAGVEALSLLFPDWLIWADDHGWHARRRGGYMQGYQHGAPAFCVHALSAVDLAAQLRWQQAADVHAPAGCAR
jgi:hypothetical protein